jgi:hypothetical protein
MINKVVQMRMRESCVYAFRRIFPLILAIGLAACHEEMSPLTKGELEYRVQSGGFISKELSANQLQELSFWLNKHSDDWSGCYSTPSPLSIFGISLNHANGKSSSISLLKYDNSSRTLRAHYLDGSNQSNQPCAFMTVTEQDINDLRTLLPLDSIKEPEFDRPTARYFYD